MIKMFGDLNDRVKAKIKQVVCALDYMYPTSNYIRKSLKIIRIHVRSVKRSALVKVCIEYCFRDIYNPNECSYGRYLWEVYIGKFGGIKRTYYNGKFYFYGIKDLREAIRDANCISKEEDYDWVLSPKYIEDKYVTVSYTHLTLPTKA